MGKGSVIIIGAGIAGLSAAVYLQRSGFDVTIYEQHTIPGGLSTGWSRKGYFFEGGMHWLTGSSEKLVLNRMWKELGALKENNPVRYREPLYTLIDGKTCIHLYRDIDKLQKECIDAAPEDRKAIEALCRDIKTFLPVHFVLRDIPWIKTKSPVIPTLRELLPMAPAAIPALYLKNVSYEDYLSRFKNKKLHALFHAVIGTRFNALSLVYTLASFASGDCGYPKGGSLRLAQNIADTFISLGGKIVYRTKVMRVVTDGQMRLRHSMYRPVQLTGTNARSKSRKRKLLNQILSLRLSIRDAQSIRFLQNRLKSDGRNGCAKSLQRNRICLLRSV